MTKADLQRQLDDLTAQILGAIEYKEGRFLVSGSPHDGSMQSKLQVLYARANNLRAGRLTP